MFTQIGRQFTADLNHTYQSQTSPIGSEEALQQEMLIQMQELRALLSLVGELNLLVTSPKPVESSKRSTSPTLRNQLAGNNLN